MNHLLWVISDKGIRFLPGDFKTVKCFTGSKFKSTYFYDRDVTTFIMSNGFGPLIDNKHPRFDFFPFENGLGPLFYEYKIDGLNVDYKEYRLYPSDVVDIIINNEDFPISPLQIMFANKEYQNEIIKSLPKEIAVDIEKYPVIHAILHRNNVEFFIDYLDLFENKFHIVLFERGLRYIVLQKPVKIKVPKKYTYYSGGWYGSEK